MSAVGPARRWGDRGVGRWVGIVQILINVIAIAALAIAIVGLLELPGSRRDSARDSCQLIKGLVYSAAPPSRLASVNSYVAGTPLHDCRAYARKLVK